MQIGVTYSEHSQQIWMTIDVPEETTAREAIERSGILQMFPHLDLSQQKVGIFGKIVKPDAALRPGDRVEVYRPIICDPQTVPRRDGFGGDDDE